MPEPDFNRFTDVPPELVERLAAIAGEAVDHPLQGGVILLLSPEGTPGLIGWVRHEGRILPADHGPMFKVLAEFVDKAREAAGG